MQVNFAANMLRCRAFTQCVIPLSGQTGDII